MKPIHAACSILMVLCATSALAAAAVDANGDGKVTQAELASYLQAQRPFSSLDKNGDGVLDANEMAGVSGAARQMEAADLNNDNVLSPSEYVVLQQSDAAFRFGSCDANHDDTLSGNEIGCSLIGIPIN